MSILKDLPPSTQNNTRDIVAHALNKAKHERFGGYWTRKVEEMTGLTGDRTPYDTGMAPAEGMEMEPLTEEI